MQEIAKFFEMKKMRITRDGLQMMFKLANLAHRGRLRLVENLADTIFSTNPNLQAITLRDVVAALELVAGDMAEALIGTPTICLNLLRRQLRPSRERDRTECNSRCISRISFQPSAGQALRPFRPASHRGQTRRDRWIFRTNFGDRRMNRTKKARRKGLQFWLTQWGHSDSAEPGILVTDDAQMPRPLAWISGDGIASRRAIERIIMGDPIEEWASSDLTKGGIYISDALDGNLLFPLKPFSLESVDESDPNRAAARYTANARGFAQFSIFTWTGLESLMMKIPVMYNGAYVERAMTSFGRQDKQDRARRELDLRRGNRQSAILSGPEHQNVQMLATAASKTAEGK